MSTDDGRGVKQQFSGFNFLKIYQVYERKSDLNGHVGEKTDGFDNVHGGFGYGERNEDGNRTLEFADSHSKFKDAVAIFIPFSIAKTVMYVVKTICFLSNVANEIASDFGIV
ncbi:hypothetical protein HELRODRAFT_180380 [Helobdella robusta]|uniref:Uncharacterized protein n=1 Tax=Helobdella robusta TaxID=6412 RepID=T1FFV0_HELRO|nr:hypothetical protein HELRODRAFT_180380 [Helobdella robusta]ESN93965.1 hypothetical protein HELRODRAFT_180380 [Helobdella robusta]